MNRAVKAGNRLFKKRLDIDKLGQASTCESEAASWPEDGPGWGKIGTKRPETGPSWPQDEQKRVQDGHLEGP